MLQHVDYIEVSIIIKILKFANTVLDNAYLMAHTSKKPGFTLLTKKFQVKCVETLISLRYSKVWCLSRSVKW